VIKQNKINLIHVNVWKYYEGLLAAKWASIPAICHIRDIVTNPVLKQFIRIITTRFADQIICVSKATRNHMFGPNPPSKVKVIYDGGPNPERFNPMIYDREATRKELKIETDSFLVCLISKLVPLKGHQIFLEAAKQLIEAGYQNVHFLIVGGALSGHEAYAHQLQDFVFENQLSEFVTFSGIRSDIPAILNSVDVLVHVPINEDPLPGVVLEAMAMAKPVIATQLAVEGIDFYDEGMLLIDNNELQLADKTVRLLQSDGTLYAGASREWVQRRYNWEKNLGPLQKLLDAGLPHLNETVDSEKEDWIEKQA